MCNTRVILLTSLNRSDIAIAVSFEIPPFLSNGSEHDFVESPQTPFRVAHNTPLVSPLVPFAQCADALGLHPATASILDDMRFMIQTVLALPEEPTPNQLQKVATTSAWIYQRILKLPALSPDERPPSQEPPEGSPLKAEATGSPGGAALHPSSAASPAGARSRRSSTHSLRTDGSGSSRAGSSSSATRGRSTTPPSAAAAGEAAPSDALYQAVRATALIYSRAISQRRPFSAAVEQAEFIRLWTGAWRVSLTEWKGLVGIFTWITLAIVASARGTPHDRFVKSMLSICTVQTSLENWDIASAALRASLRLNAWLAGGSSAAAKGKAAAGDKMDVDDADADADADADVDVGAGAPGRASAGEGLVDFTAEAATRFSGGGKAIREKGSAIPGWVDTGSS